MSFSSLQPPDGAALHFTSPSSSLLPIPFLDFNSEPEPKPDSEPDNIAKLAALAAEESDDDYTSGDDDASGEEEENNDPFQALAKKGYFWDTLDEAFDYLHTIAEMHGFHIIKARANSRKDGTTAGYDLRCDHGDQNTKSQKPTIRTGAKTKQKGCTWKGRIYQFKSRPKPAQKIPGELGKVKFVFTPDKETGVSSDKHTGHTPNCAEARKSAHGRRRQRQRNPHVIKYILKHASDPHLSYTRLAALVESTFGVECRGSDVANLWLKHQKKKGGKRRRKEQQKKDIITI